MSGIEVDEMTAGLLGRLSRIAGPRDFAAEIGRLLRSGELDPETLHEFKKNLSPEERELTETAFAAAVSRPASVVAGRTVSGVVRLVDAEAGRAVIAPDTGTPGFVVVQVTPGGIGAKDLHENQHVVAEIDAGAEHEPLAAKIVK